MPLGQRIAHMAQKGAGASAICAARRSSARAMAVSRCWRVGAPSSHDCPDDGTIETKVTKWETRRGLKRGKV